MVAKTVDRIDELLDLARIQADQPLPLNLAPVDLVDLTRRIVSEHQQAVTVITSDLYTPLPRWWESGIYLVWNEFSEICSQMW